MPIFMLIIDILCVCMLLACSLCFITTMFMRERDQVKSMILGPVLIRRKFPSYFYVVLIAAIKSKNYKKKL
jgi:hypothetical protein